MQVFYHWTMLFNFLLLFVFLTFSSRYTIYLLWIISHNAELRICPQSQSKTLFLTMDNGLLPFLTEVLAFSKNEPCLVWIAIEVTCLTVLSILPRSFYHVVSWPVRCHRLLQCWEGMTAVTRPPLAMLSVWLALIFYLFNFCLNKWFWIFEQFLNKESLCFTS